MNIQFDKTGNVSAKLTIQLTKDDYQPKVDKALKDISRKAQMPGFRPGKVPMNLIKKMYGTQTKADEINKLLQDSLFNYIKENKVNMLGEPLGNEEQKPQDIETQDDFSFAFDIALSPEFDIKLTDKDTIDYYDIEVSEDAITKQLGALQQQAGHPESVEVYADKDILRGTLAELDADGNPKEGGIVVDTASLMPTYFKDEEQKKLFEGAKKNEVITFNPSKAYNGNEAELSSLLKIKKEEVAGHTGDFSYQVDEISRFMPAELNEEFFTKTFGKDADVKDEASARAKIKEQIQSLQVNDSDYKFLLDLRAYCEKKVGTLEFPDDLLKRFLQSQNKDKEEDYVEKNYPKSVEELKWQLIKSKLVSAQGIKVEDKDVKQAALQAARYQFAQYGMNNIPDEYLENYAQEMLKHREQVNGLVERCIDQKLTAALKNVVNLNHKPVSAEDFTKLFEEADKQ